MSATLTQEQANQATKGQTENALAFYIAGDENPQTAPGVSALKGTIYVQKGTSNLWKKLDDGLSQNWEPIGSTIGPGKYAFENNFVEDADPIPYIDTSGGTGASAHIPSEVGHVGILQQQVSAVADTNVITMPNGSLQDASGVQFLKILFRIPVLSTALQEFVARIGAGDGVGADFSDGAYLEYDRSVSGDVVRLKTAKAGVRTTVVSSVPIVANQWYELSILLTPTQAIFSLDGVVLATISTNIPNTDLTGMRLTSQLIKSVGATQRNLDLDYWSQVSSY